jgi:hypothetical protein
MDSPWVSRVLNQLGHEVIVAHARNVRLIGESRRKDDRLDARTLARLARIDPQLLTPASFIPRCWRWIDPAVSRLAAPVLTPIQACLKAGKSICQP